MKEDFLHYLWKYQLYKNALTLHDGTRVDVLSPGEHNYDSGPDFFNAKVKIGDKVWAGNVEIHVLASDWFKHNHQKNDAFNNVILHVVGNNNADIKRKNDEIIPTVELKSAKGLYEQYLYLMQSKSWVPCESFIKSVNEITLNDWKNSLMIERLQEKSGVIKQRLILNNNNWEETFYQTLAANFGFKTNALPFEMLAKSLPIIYLGKHKDQIELIEAMVFGQSGLLPVKPTDAYTQQLARDYEHLKNKFSLQPLSGHLWKYLRSRPSNFPTIRLAQFASLIHNSSALMSKIFEADSFSQVQQYFIISVSNYWETHYVFGKETTKQSKGFGTNAFQNIIINTVAPFFVLYAQEKKLTGYAEKAIDWLLQITAEQNKITKHWQLLGLKVENAFDSQSLIQLKNIYCSKRKCLNCRIGNQVIQHKL